MPTNNFRGQYSFALEDKPFVTLINMNSLRLLSKGESIKFSELDAWLSESPFESIPMMVWYGCKNFMIRKGNEDDLMPFEQFCAIALDEDGLFEEMTKWVTESLGGDEEAQKKTRATRRKATPKK